MYPTSPAKFFAEFEQSCPRMFRAPSMGATSRRSGRVQMLAISCAVPPCGSHPLAEADMLRLGLLASGGRGTLCRSALLVCLWLPSQAAQAVCAGRGLPGRVAAPARQQWRDLGFKHLPCGGVLAGRLVCRDHAGPQAWEFGICTRSLLQDTTDMQRKRHASSEHWNGCQQRTGCRTAAFSLSAGAGNLLCKIRVKVAVRPSMSLSSRQHLCRVQEEVGTGHRLAGCLSAHDWTSCSPCLAEQGSCQGTHGEGGSLPYCDVLDG